MDRLELEGEVKKCRAPPELIFFVGRALNCLSPLENTTLCSRLRFLIFHSFFNNFEKLL